MANAVKSKRSILVSVIVTFSSMLLGTVPVSSEEKIPSPGANGPVVGRDEAVKLACSQFSDSFYRAAKYPDEQACRLIDEASRTADPRPEVLFWRSRDILHSAGRNVTDAQKAEAVNLVQRAAEAKLDVAIATDAAQQLTMEPLAETTKREQGVRLAGAMERREPEALRLAGVLYQLGAGFKKDLTRSEKTLRMSVALGHVRANADLAITLLLEDQPEDALRAMKVAAEAGNAPSQLEMGRWFLAGTATRVNVSEGRRWLRAAADQGFPDAKCELGLELESRSLSGPDRAEALRLFTETANQVPESKYHLAKALLFGSLDGKQDVKQAERLLRELADSGHIAARYDLGFALLTGWWLPRDEAAGLRYLEAAAAKGNADAKKVLSLRKALGTGEATGNSKTDK